MPAAPSPLYIKFFGDVDKDAVGRLMDAVDHGLRTGRREFVLLISTVGGSVFHGLSAYNFLAGIPARVTTHNFGSVDSVGAVLYCAGRRRYSVPQARFVLHTPFFEFDDETLGERQLAERLGKLRVDARNMAEVLARETARDPHEVLRALKARTVLDVPEAVRYGLVHEVRAELLPEGADLVTVTHAPEPDERQLARLLLHAAARGAPPDEEPEVLVRARAQARSADPRQAG